MVKANYTFHHHSQAGSVLNLMTHIISNYLKTSDTVLQCPVAPKTLIVNRFVMNDEEKKSHLASLTYLVPGYHTLAPMRAGKGGPKGRKNGVPKFPSPDQASRLNKVFSMVKTYQRTQIVSTTTLSTTGAYYVDYNSVNDSGSLSAVFDQYRIALVEITFIPDATVAIAGGTASASAPPMFYSAVDLDDNTAVSLNQLQDYPGCKSTLCTSSHKHVFVPHCALAAYSGSFTSYANVTAPWIDVASPAVQHYGVKYAWGAATTVCGYEVIIRILLEFRNVR